MGEIIFALVQAVTSAGAGYCAASAVGPFLEAMIDGVEIGKTTAKIGVIALKCSVAAIASKTVSDSFDSISDIIKLAKKKEVEED